MLGATQPGGFMILPSSRKIGRFTPITLSRLDRTTSAADIREQRAPGDHDDVEQSVDDLDKVILLFGLHALFVLLFEEMTAQRTKIIERLWREANRVELVTLLHEDLRGVQQIDVGHFVPQSTSSDPRISGSSNLVSLLKFGRSWRSHSSIISQERSSSISLTRVSPSIRQRTRRLATINLLLQVVVCGQPQPRTPGSSDSRFTLRSTVQRRIR